MPYFQRSPIGDEKTRPTYKLHIAICQTKRRKLLNFSLRWKRQGSPLQVKILQLSVKDLRNNLNQDSTGTLNIIQELRKKPPPVQSFPRQDGLGKPQTRGVCRTKGVNLYSTTREKVENKTRDTEKTIIPNPSIVSTKGSSRRGAPPELKLGVRFE